MAYRTAQLPMTLRSWRSLLPF